MGYVPPPPPRRDTWRLTASLPPGATSAEIHAPQSAFLNCRNCGAPPRSGGLACPYCGTQRTPLFFGGARGRGMAGTGYGAAGAASFLDAVAGRALDPIDGLLATPTPGRLEAV